MAKRKLEHFAELETFSNVIQQPFKKDDFDHPLKGKWGLDFFKNKNPLTLELGCGKGEYTVEMARKYPERNFIGVDIKGNRLWRGAKTALDENIPNVAFIRTQVDRISNFFGAQEVSEIWITFPDPKPKKGNARKRLTSKEMLERYRMVLENNGSIHLKTDSDLNFDFTLETIQENGYHLLRKSFDIDKDFPGDELLQIRTYYEKKFREHGLPIHYICFNL